MPKNAVDIQVDPSKAIGEWFVWPDSLQNGRFRGFEDRDEESQLRGSFILGQNVTLGGANLPSIRQGFAPVGTEATNATPVQRAWLFERRDTVQIEMKAYDTGLYAFIVGVSTEFELIKGGFTAAQEFGFANIGKSGETFSWVIFGNGKENSFYWMGAYGMYASDNGSNQITVSGSVTLAALGFPATGSLIISGVAITYTGLSSQTFTGCSAVPPSPTVGDIIYQVPIELTGVIGGGIDPSKFHIAMAHDGRLHYIDEADPSKWVYSKLDDPLDITPGVADSSGGAKQLEFGGPAIGLGKLNKAAICFKNRLIKLLQFSQVGTRLDVPFYQTLVSVDDKGTTLGGVNQKSTFSTPSGLVFITPDKRMMLLTGVTANSEPQYICISDPIQPIFSAGFHDTATGICVDNKIWYSFKADVNSATNDTVLVGNMLKQTFDATGRILPIQWDTPITGWNVNDWTVIKNTDGENELHFHSALNSSTYKVITDKTDNTQSFTATIRTWAETFGLPLNQKRIDMGFIEIKLKENSEVTATLLYDENGYTQQSPYKLLGTDTDNRFSSPPYNPFGAFPFGSQKFGSNPAVDDLQLYRFDLEVKPNIRFFNMSMQISIDGQGQDFELVRFGYRLAEVIKDRDKKFRVGTT